MESLKLLGFLFAAVILPVVVISYIYSKKRVFFKKTVKFLDSVIIGFVIILSGVSIIVYQVYSYLKTGSWHEVPLMIAIPYLHISWIENPKSWYGLHEIIYWLLENIPFSLFLMLFGWIVMRIEEQRGKSDGRET